MDVRKLRYFVAAAEEENFHRAAARVFVAQPALTRYIRQLEEELGVQLFERVKKRVRLAPAGVLFLKHAKSILQGVDSALSEMKHIAAGKEGLLRLSFIPSALSHAFVPKSVDLFRMTNPKVDLDLRVMTTRAAVEALRAGEIDAAFVHRPPDDVTSDLAIMKVARTDWVLALPANHILSEVEDIKLADFRGENFLWIPREQSKQLFDQVEAICAAAGLSMKIIRSSGDILTYYFRLVAAGLGVTMTASTIAQEHQGGSIVFRQVPGLPPPYFTYLVSLRSTGSSTLPRYVSTLKAMLKEVNDNGRF